MPAHLLPVGYGEGNGKDITCICKAPAGTYSITIPSQDVFLSAPGEPVFSG